ncbi:DNA-binding protein [Rhodopseudomonas sp. P1]|uniref:DNA-binding protein n=1 Tax=Rhodopseudomonas sp. P1 TaxID=3434357 RepID=UPI0031FCB1DB
MDEFDEIPALPSSISGDQRTRPASAAPLAGDILSGANEIAEFLYGDRKHRRKVYNLVEADCLPVFRLGANICARRSVLLAWIEKQEAG